MAFSKALLALLAMGVPVRCAAKIAALSSSAPTSSSTRGGSNSIGGQLIRRSSTRGYRTSIPGCSKSTKTATTASIEGRTGRRQRARPNTHFPLRPTDTSALIVPETNSMMKMVAGMDGEESTPYNRHLRTSRMLSRVSPRKLNGLEKQLTKASAAAYGVCFVSIAYTACLLMEAAGSLKILQKKEVEGKIARFIGLLADRVLPIFPFINIEVSGAEHIQRENTPTVWVANHVSELDLLVFLILEGRLDIGKKRPIKFLYWDKLNEYPVLSRFLRTSGMIPVSMEDTGPSNFRVFIAISFEVDNKYLLQSLKSMNRAMDKAIKDGFDVAILPEGRRNTDAPTLAKAFPGAFKLAKKHGAKIGFIGTHGVEEVWNVKDGFHANSKHVRWV
eukprot:jgi/Bigna1/80554/fgenesh1_pg.72_\